MNIDRCYELVNKYINNVEDMPHFQIIPDRAVFQNSLFITFCHTIPEQYYGLIKCIGISGLVQPNKIKLRISTQGNQKEYCVGDLNTHNVHQYFYNYIDLDIPLISNDTFVYNIELERNIVERDTTVNFATWVFLKKENDIK